MATNTSNNVGIRRLIYSLPVPAYRNFEPAGGALYVAVRAVDYAGTRYAPGTTIPFDAAGGTRYTNDDLMERFFNSGDVDPVA